MHLRASTRHREGVTLVHVRVHNDGAVPRRVRVANRLDGPVWFPRRGGHPAPGWDDGGFEGVLAPGERRALGYASPAAPADPPVELAWTERAASAAAAGTPAAEDWDPALAAARALADPCPPRGAVPVDPAVPTPGRRAAVRPAERTPGDPEPGTAGDQSDPPPARGRVAALLDNAAALREGLTGRWNRLAGRRDR